MNVRVPQQATPIGGWALSQAPIRLLIMSAICYAVLATGAVLPRSVLGFSFFGHTLIVGATALLLLWHSEQTRAIAARASFVLLPFVILIGISALFSSNAEYAVHKIEGAVLATLLLVVVWGYLITRYGERATLLAFVSVAFAVLLLTVAYKVHAGFGDRSVRFLVNGPIVFGWLMGISALVCAYLWLTDYRRVGMVALGAVFLAAVFWTGSKGPIVAVCVASVLLATYLRGIKVALICVVLFLAALIIAYFVLPQEITARFTSLWRRLLSEEVAALDINTLGVRFSAAQLSIALIVENWLSGVGLGNWPIYADAVPGISHIDYPHNVFLEVASEAGVPAMIALLSVLGYLLLKGGPMVATWVVFFGLCMSFSGDLPYLRLLLSYPLAMVMARHLVRMDSL